MKYAVQLFERSFKPRRVSFSCIVYRPSTIRVLYVKRDYFEYRVQIIIICRRVRHVIYRYAVKFSSRQDESRSRMTDVVPELSANHDRTCSITRMYVNNLVPNLVTLLLPGIYFYFYAHSILVQFSFILQLHCQT